MIFEDDTTISEDFRRRPNISEDVPNNFEILKKMIMLHTDLQLAEISGKHRHLLVLHDVFLSRIGLNLHIFGSVSQFSL